MYICSRHKEAIEAVRCELANQAGDGTVFAMQADASNPASVDSLMNAASRDLPDLMGVVNNAGVLGPKGLLEDINWADWWRTIEVNLLGTMLCCHAILPVLRRAHYGKIINLSGGGATAPMPRMSAYAASKAAVVRFTETFAAECTGQNIDVNAVAPGALDTRMLEEVLVAGPEKVGSAHYDRAVRQKENGGASLDRQRSCVSFSCLGSPTE